MDIILIPGLWLDASSWDDVLPTLRAAGLNPRPLTLPGLGAPASDSADIGMSDWVQAVVDEIDAADGPVMVVGHSGGGNVAWAAADARPDRVARVVLVDTAVPHDGGPAHKNLKDWLNHTIESVKGSDSRTEPPMTMGEVVVDSNSRSAQ